MQIEQSLKHPSVQFFGTRFFGCGCGKRKGKSLEGHTPAERKALQRSGYLGEDEDGTPVIRALLLKRRFRCERGHIHRSDSAVFRCPFGPDPACILTHGWVEDDAGYRAPHCTGPLRPKGNYRIVAEDHGLPRRMMKGIWGCPTKAKPFRHRPPSGRGTDAPPPP